MYEKEMKNTRGKRDKNVKEKIISCHVRSFLACKVQALLLSLSKHPQSMPWCNF